MMTQTQDLEPQPAEIRNSKPRLLHRVIARLHAWAERADLVPSEFGTDQPVDSSDGAALLAEWRRQFRRWADHSPEQMLAIKAGAVVLGLVLLGLVVLVRALPTHG